MTRVGGLGNRRGTEMNTKEAADALGTSARTLRQFLRSPASTFTAVGSGARYEFRDTELATLRMRFEAWAKAGAPKPPVDTPAKPKPTPNPVDMQRARDRAVWIEEGTAHADGTPIKINLPDMRDPRVRAAIRREETARQLRLDMMLMAVGQHITQRAG